jgi:hypothetical protein
MVSRTSFVLAFFFLFSALLSAQQANTGAVTGIVTDPQGAVIARAQVTARNSATNATRTTRSNNSGNYLLSNLVPGEYRIEVEASTFKRMVQTVEVAVGQVVRADIGMKVGETIVADVFGTAPVNTTTSTIDSVIDTRTIEQLPLNGRNYLELALLVPGNAPAPNFDPTKAGTVQIASAGQLGRGGNITIDGADNNDDVVGGALHNVPQDAVQEFQIATNRYSAELGRSGSSVINVVTKPAWFLLFLRARRESPGIARHLRP